jgi:heme/copper-type cytochrome/quinol oxidase subunit 3
VSEERRVIDVSDLPTHAYGARDPLWWAIVMLVAIEGTMFALLLVSYFYLRENAPAWPVNGVGTVDLRWGTASAVLLFLSAPTIHMQNRAAIADDIPGMRRWLIAGTALIAASLALRGVELTQLPFRWDDNAYASTFWTILGLHTFHMVTTTGENLLLLAVLFRGPVEAKFPVDVHVSGVYTYFVIGSWVPLFAVLYLERSIWP